VKYIFFEFFEIYIFEKCTMYLQVTLSTVGTWIGDRLQTGEPLKGLAGAAVSPVLYRIVRN
jgi:hypothetical protein